MVHCSSVSWHDMMATHLCCWHKLRNWFFRTFSVNVIWSFPVSWLNHRLIHKTCQRRISNRAADLSVGSLKTVVFVEKVLARGENDLKRVNLLYYKILTNSRNHTSLPCHPRYGKFKLIKKWNKKTHERSLELCNHRRGCPSYFSWEQCNFRRTDLSIIKSSVTHYKPETTGDTWNKGGGIISKNCLNSSGEKILKCVKIIYIRCSDQTVKTKHFRTSFFGKHSTQ